MALVLVGNANSQEPTIRDIVGKIMSHPSLGDESGVYFIREKEPLRPEQPAAYDWSWNMHDITIIEVPGQPVRVVLEVRKYQNTGNSPSSAVAVYYTIIDDDLDGIADLWYREIRMLIMEEPFDGQTLSMSACPDDVCKYNFKDIQEVYKDELKFWQNKLQ